MSRLAAAGENFVKWRRFPASDQEHPGKKGSANNHIVPPCMWPRCRYSSLLEAYEIAVRSNSTILGINFGQSFASIAVIGKVSASTSNPVFVASIDCFSQEGHASCIANEEGERQIACAVSYNGEEIVRRRLCGRTKSTQSNNSNGSTSATGPNRNW